MNWTTKFIDLMARIGQAYDLKTVSKQAILNQKLAYGDGTHRPASIKDIPIEHRDQDLS